MKVPSELKGFRTMFTSFHHFSPEEARAILQNAADAGEGIGIFEITRRAPLTIGLMFSWVVMLFVCTPWIRPFRWSRLLWTYLIPIIPVVLLFDGVVSCLRTYRPQELREIVDKLTAKRISVGDRRAFEWASADYLLDWLSAGMCRRKSFNIRQRCELQTKSFFSPPGTTSCSPGNCRRSEGLFPRLFCRGGGGMFLGNPSRVNSARQSFSRGAGYRRR